jgi:hypothetical protein
MTQLEILDDSLGETRVCQSAGPDGDQRRSNLEVLSHVVGRSNAARPDDRRGADALDDARHR